ncbi:hypothetical protein, partial [Escherichia coli]|uniref:hypothetical protein n=1 Tax=Escherichia coli TaxID=562 RepID=UPI003CE774AE
LHGQNHEGIAREVTDWVGAFTRSRLRYLHEGGSPSREAQAKRQLVNSWRFSGIGWRAHTKQKCCVAASDDI